MYYVFLINLFFYEIGHSCKTIASKIFFLTHNFRKKAVLAASSGNFHGTRILLMIMEPAPKVRIQEFYVLTNFEVFNWIEAGLLF